MELGCPTKYPYLCFLERVRKQERRRSLSPREVCRAENAEENESEGESGGDVPAEPAPKRRRLRGKQTLAPVACAGRQTPAKRSLLSGGAAARKTMASPRESSTR